jgi:hypothetical protein
MICSSVQTYIRCIPMRLTRQTGRDGLKACALITAFRMGIRCSGLLHCMSRLMAHPGRADHRRKGRVIGADRKSPARTQNVEIDPDQTCGGPPGSLDHLVGDGEQPRWQGEAERPGSREVDYELQLGRLHRPAMRREDFPCQPGAVHTCAGFRTPVMTMLTTR